MSTRPNILVVMADDHGAWAVNVAGCKAVHTPAMNWLTETGCRFECAYAPSPVCSPARASFFTGLIPSAHGVHDWIDERAWRDTEWLAGNPNLAEQLQAAGYETALIGKWHCGRSHVPQPGFDHWFSHAQGHQYPHFGPQSFATERGLVSAQGRQSRLLFDHARHWLRTRETGRPFFLFYSPVDTHSPFEGHPQWLVSAMRRADFSRIPYEPKRYPPERRALPFPETEDERREHLAQYLAAVTCIDAQLGGLLDTLDEIGTLENTLVLYTSDHGHMNGQHGLVGKGNGSTPQNFFEESIRVPCMARLPAMIPAGSVVGVPIDHCDWFTTLLEVGGVAPRAEPRRGPGLSLMPWWEATPAGWRSEQVCEYGNARMIRTDSKKLIVRNGAWGRSFPDEFYDLSIDPGESENRVHVSSYAPEIARLRKQLAAYFERWGVAEKSGWDVERLPRFNSDEPWCRHGGEQSGFGRPVRPRGSDNLHEKIPYSAKDS